jgi:hypothetical protein
MRDLPLLLILQVLARLLTPREASRLCTSTEVSPRPVFLGYSFGLLLSRPPHRKKGAVKISRSMRRTTVLSGIHSHHSTEPRVQVKISAWLGTSSDLLASLHTPRFEALESPGALPHCRSVVRQTSAQHGYRQGGQRQVG